MRRPLFRRAIACNYLQRMVVMETGLLQCTELYTVVFADNSSGFQVQTVMRSQWPGADARHSFAG